MQALLADLILIIHFAFVLFVAGSLPLIWIGAAMRWSWVRHRGYRITHLAAILLVTAEAAAGVWCPLTVWEDQLRGTSGDPGFVARWIHWLMFYRFPDWVFTTAYTVFTLAVILTWRLIPPQRQKQ